MRHVIRQAASAHIPPNDFALIKDLLLYEVYMLRIQQKRGIDTC